MKKMWMVLFLLCGSAAFANDTSIPYIEVDDLTFTEADIGTKISFKGAEAMSLFNALPINDVMDSTRGFTATGKKKSVVINCSRTTWSEKKQDFDVISGGPVCTISVAKAMVKDGESDYQKWVNTRTPQNVPAKKPAPKK